MKGKARKSMNLKFERVFNLNVLKRKKRRLVGYIIFISVFNVTRN